MTHLDKKPHGAALVFRYGLFALVATLANLAAQRIVFAIAQNDMRYLLALFAGTGIGLVVKYVLDRRWIFYAAAHPAAAETRRFSLYTLTGVGTTLIFWGFETVFWMIWQTQTMRESGAVLGLSTGYVIKYHLDRRYVFRT